jgi:hypothetical protein
VKIIVYAQCDGLQSGRILPTFRRNLLLTSSMPKISEAGKQSSACSTVRSTVFWDVTSCSLVDVYRLFEAFSASIFKVKV